MSRYAAKTDVSVERTRAEIETTLMRYGAESFAYAVDGREARLGFRMKGRQFKFALTLPDPKDKTFTHSSRGMREEHVARAAWEQACRSHWRALLLVIKAKLEAVTAGITTLEDEFLAHIMLPDGSTVGQWARDEVERVYLSGDMPRSLLIEDQRGRK